MNEQNLGAATIDSVACAFERVVMERVPCLREPQILDGARAVRVAGWMVETLAGYALGVVAGELVRAVRPWFGDEMAARVIVAIDATHVGRTDASGTLANACVRTGHRDETPNLTSGETRHRRFLADADARPLVDELGARLLARLRLAVADIRAIVAATLACIPADRARTVAAMLERVAAETLVRERLDDELVRGWAHVCAAIEGVPPPELGNDRARALWRAWARRAGVPTVREVVEDRPNGAYILAI